jgi:hypothetical protein
MDPLDQPIRFRSAAQSHRRRQNVSFYLEILVQTGWLAILFFFGYRMSEDQ